MSASLKRKFDEVEEDPCYSSASPSSSLSSSAYSGWDSDGDSCYSDTLDSRPSNPSSPTVNVPLTSILKKSKRVAKGSVRFDQVTVFSFPRCQGFTSVPSRGGCSLGMLRQHSARHDYSMPEFAVLQRQQRREKLKARLQEEKLEALKLKLTRNGTCVSEEAALLTVEDVSEGAVDVSGVELEDATFLHPYTSRRRHALLKAAGVKKIDKEEKRQLHELRVSREDCGCDCQGFCEPETCTCSLAGIKCQMDHSSFPCGCTKDGCANTEGRIEFNSGRVRTHYIHTLMKLELEKRLEESGGEGDGPAFRFEPAQAVAAGENSCSSDMTDSSSSSAPSEDSEAAGSPCAEVDDNGLARILSFGDSDTEGEDNGRLTDSWTPLTSGYLDENANHPSPAYEYPNTPSPSIDHTSKSYMDLSLSSDSDLEFLHGFPDYMPGSIRDYHHTDNFLHLPLPSYPPSDSSTCFLESLMGLPEPSLDQPDCQLLEEAMKASVVEPVKV